MNYLNEDLKNYYKHKLFSELLESAPERYEDDPEDNELTQEAGVGSSIIRGVRRVLVRGSKQERILRNFKNFARENRTAIQVKGGPSGRSLNVGIDFFLDPRHDNMWHVGSDGAVYFRYMDGRWFRWVDGPNGTFRETKIPVGWRPIDVGIEGFGNEAQKLAPVLVTPFFGPETDYSEPQAPTNRPPIDASAPYVVA